MSHGHGDHEHNAMHGGLVPYEDLQDWALETQTRPQSEHFPLAICGIGVKLPNGATSVPKFWNILENGVDCIAEVPADRWSLDAFFSETNVAGKMVSKWGGFVDGVDMFDAAFFKISPRESEQMDPQHRMLLEVSWEALEDAGKVPSTLSKATGVFIGLGMMDYPMALSEDPLLMGSYVHTGNAHCSAANRLSFFYDVQGPSYACDTACASSMTALHACCAALWSKECPEALIGGVNIMLDPAVTVGFSSLGVLSPRGRCHAFSTKADGYVRAEGLAVLYLKPVEAAVAEGCHIYAQIIGSSVAHVGKTASLTMPETNAQASVIVHTYKRFGVPLSSVKYCEAHGTGTPVGDPIESNAIGSALGAGAEGRTERLRVGSSKSNFGHLEHGAGMVGMLKTILQLHYRKLVPSIHCEDINPEILVDELNIKIQRELEPFWDDEPWTMGVNSFGFAGALAHCILQSAPAYVEPTAEQGRKEPAGWTLSPAGSAEAAAAGSGKAVLLPLSTRDSQALNDLAGRYLEFDSQGLDVQDLAGWLATRREHHDHRLGVVAGSLEELHEGLRAAAAGEPAPGVVTGKLPAPIANGEERNRICFVFPGQGQEWEDMGRHLFAQEPVFRETVERGDAHFKTLSEYSLIEDCGLFGPKGEETRLKTSDVVQPALFLLQAGLFELWKSWGVHPDAIVGHSAGECAAAYACGSLTLEEAVFVVFHRSVEQATLGGSGRMLAIGMGCGDATELIKTHPAMSVAAINSPDSVALAGPAEAVDAVATELAECEIFNRKLRGNTAFHCAAMDPIKDAILAKLAPLAERERAPQVPCYSTVTGQLYTGDHGAQYWWDNVRNPVQFEAATKAVLADGISVFLELSAHPTLIGSIKQCLAPGQSIDTLFSGRRKENEHRVILANLANAWATVGASLDWTAITGTGRWVPDLPHYPWQHESYYLEPEGRRERRLGLVKASYRGLGGRCTRPLFPFIADHVVEDNVVFPAAGYTEYAMEMFCDQDEVATLEDVVFASALFWPKEDCDLQVSAARVGSRFEVSSKGGVVNCYGSVGSGASLEDTEQPVIDVATLVGRCTEEVSGETLYSQFKDIGLKYGKAFQGVERMLMGDDEAVAFLKPAYDQQQRLHTTVLDAAYQAGLAATRMTTAMYLPTKLGSLKVYGSQVPTGATVCHARVVDVDSRELVCDLDICDAETGAVYCEVRGFVAQCLGGNTTEADLSQCLYKMNWQTQESCMPPTSIIWDDLTDLSEWDDEIELMRQVQERLPALTEIAAQYIKHALDVVDPADYHPRNARYVARLRQITSDTHTPLHQLRRQMQEHMDALPQLATELSLVLRLGEHLPQTLVDPDSALQILFAPDALAQFFVDSLSTRPYYKAIAKTVNHAVREAAKHKDIIRIFEIGGRMGGHCIRIMESLRDLFDEGRIEYVLTEEKSLAASFFDHAKHRLVDFPVVKYMDYDVEYSAESQGVTAGSFDMVVVLDTVHSAVNIPNSMRNMKGLLAPGGWFVMTEPTNSDKIMEVIFGSYALCWAYNDFREIYCWLKRNEWIDALNKYGFCDVQDFSFPGEFFHTVFYARNAPDVVVDAEEYKEVSEDVAVKPDRFAEELMEMHLRGEVPKATNWQIVTEVGESDPVVAALKAALAAKDPSYTVGVIELPAGADAHATVTGRIGAGAGAALVYVPRSLGLADDVAGMTQPTQHLLSLCKCVAALEKVGLWVVTQGAQPRAEGQPAPNLAGAMNVGFLRATANEFTEDRVFSVDLELGDVAPQMEAAVRTITTQFGFHERELCITNGQVHTPRMQHVAQPLATAGDEGSASWRLERPDGAAPGADSLVFCATGAMPVGEGQIKVEVRAAGLNFKDIMLSKGMLDELAAQQGSDVASLGFECAGVVAEVGAGVEGLSVGQEVVCFANDCFARYAVCSAQTALPKPANLSWAEAAGSSTIFVTAHHVLNKLAQIEEGETVLIHSAMGGVGQAAIQLAKAAGANIIATAGTPEKREALKALLGHDHVSDSRSLAFVDDVKAWTDGRGVDVVLNSLAGEKLLAGVSLLAPGGRFLEIGKADILSNSGLGLRPFLENKTFFSAHIDLLLRDRPRAVRRALAEVLERLASGALAPVPTQSWDMADFREGFAAMSTGTHTGKLAFTVPEGWQPETVAPAMRLFNGEGMHLLTGGFGGLGAVTARWLVKRGARHIALVSRRGATTRAAQRVVRNLEREGATVYCYQGDVSQRADVDRVVADLQAAGKPPLVGVYHFAMVLKDGLVVDMTPEDLERVLQPKAIGALHLHAATANIDTVQKFIVTSTVSTVVGNPEQANYSAANAMLDALVNQRLSEGKPACSLQLGALRGAGVVEASTAVAKIIGSRGFRTVHVDEVCDCLGNLIAAGADSGVWCFADMDWYTLFESLKIDTAKYSHMGKLEASSVNLDMTPEELEAAIVERLAELVGMPPHKLDVNQSMTAYGVDSLMSVEVIAMAKNDFGITLSQLDIFSGLTTKSLIESAASGKLGIMH